MKQLERKFEHLLFTSRWLMAPVYLGLVLAMLVLLFKFVKEVWSLFAHLATASGGDLIIGVLSLVDIALIMNLLIIIMFSGYENFVSRIDIDEGVDKLAWLGKLDSGSLKLKVAASIVAISSIHLLKVFMNVEKIADNDKIMWYVIIHMVFVLSAIGMSLIDKMTVKSAT